MSEYWAERQRRTNQLIRIITNNLFDSPPITPIQIYGLCKLTWITASHSGADASYIRSTKIPALSDIFNQDYSHNSLQEIALELAGVLNAPEAESLILSDTGFTNFYNAYRNTAREWIVQNHNEISPLFKSAIRLKSDDEGSQLASAIDRLPSIAKANHDDKPMPAQYLLTPAFFALDPRLRFPLINGNSGVTNLLRLLDVKNQPLISQYHALIGLYGHGGIKDAADLDQAGHDLPHFLTIQGAPPTRQLLQQQETEGHKLPLKDESDIQSLLEARTVTAKRVHNSLTNKLKSILHHYTLLEGCANRARYDVMVQNYNQGKNNLMIEVKSSIEIAHIRMAIGQLYSYWHHIYKEKYTPHLAILLPGEPDDEIKALLSWQKIGLLWIEQERLFTCTDWLQHLAAVAPTK